MPRASAVSGQSCAHSAVITALWYALSTTHVCYSEIAELDPTPAHFIPFPAGGLAAAKISPLSGCPDTHFSGVSKTAHGGFHRLWPRATPPVAATCANDRPHFSHQRRTLILGSGRLVGTIDSARNFRLFRNAGVARSTRTLSGDSGFD